MNVTFLGTCSGTEPYPDRHHSSFVIEHRDSIYWFDAGETCSYTAYLLGIDLFATRAIFISHTHMDHIGGLPNLLWTLRKLNTIAEPEARRLSSKTVKIYLPDLAVWRGIMQLLKGTEGDFALDFQLEPSRVEDGLIFDEDGLRVIALHNRHMGTPQAGERWQCFSFRVEANGQSLVYSGDVKNIRELDLLLDDCDALLMETGHHAVEDICHYLKEAHKPVGQLVFTHHGVPILTDPAGELQKARAILGDRVSFAYDGMKLTWQ
jgi:ribonuclease BN (tRNA processing enzyme)